MAPSRLIGADGGFTLVETIVAVALLGVVMAALAPFLVNSLRVVAQQADRQTAVLLADGAMEQVRAIRRPRPGNPLPLPTPINTVLDGIGYTVSWTQAACGRAATADACDAVAPGDTTYYRVLVTVTWPDSHCPTSCTYQTSTLVNTDADPLFESV